MEKCLNCPNEFEAKPRGVYTKKFCSEACKARYNAKRRYYRLKDDPNYKLKNKLYFKEWIKTNKYKYVDCIRLANKKKQTELRVYRKANNLCYHCGSVKEDLNISLCNKCRDKRRVKK